MRQFLFSLAPLVIVYTLTGCSSGLNDALPKDEESVEAGSARATQTYTVDSVSFTMVYAPVDSRGLVFKTGADDIDGYAAVWDPYWIGETEVTYELWKAVYDWATKDAGSGKRADGGPLYFFANAGTIGSSGSGSTKQPVTTISWRDAMVLV